MASNNSGITHHHIRISVDEHGVFTYFADNGDAAHFHVNVGDTIKWSLKIRGEHAPFTIEFPDFGPFGIQNRVARSFGGPTLPFTVAVSKFYPKNYAMKYNVILTNGWSDDPDIVPIPADGVTPTLDTPNAPVLLSVDESGLIITPPNAALHPGNITWKWDPNTNPADRDDFTLTFDPAVVGWPPSLDSQGTQEIVYPFKAVAGNNRYVITTKHLILSKAAYLSVA
jgi:hypothetical protein